MKSFCSPKTSQKIMNGVFILSGVITLLILVIILGYILVKGLPVINFEFLFSSPIDAGREGGIFPMIISSIYVVFIAAIIATPLGVGAAIYMSEYASNQKVIKFIRFGYIRSLKESQLRCSICVHPASAKARPRG